MSGRVRVAAVQAEPKWLNLAAGVEQAIELIEAAADGGAQLVAFPETFLPGFPWWMWLNSVDWGEEFLARYLANALTAEGPELRAIAYAARRRGIHVSIGFAERSGREVYMSQAIVDADGEISIARKGEPTGLERTVFRAAENESLLVRDTALGRIGVLGGADHLRPALRARLQEEREQIHVAAWSGFTVYYGEGKEWGPELNTSASVRYAMDGATYVLAPVAVVPVAGWEVVDARLPDRRLLRGGGGDSRIFGPGGLELAPPLDEGTEGLLFADLDLSRGPRPAPAPRGGECRKPSGRIARREPARA
ncbi:nitrilase-related carbon-nitrogen hydrolase [Nocardia asteroides]|uniref:nitrilase-related carbon-nitrogen hydrolase n=1 Tax=Nocardia asteroides TaxID=1824 RepID=UPI001E59DFF0|nr:nitrilase-related carbon-nitrogen hydrolase [Nocardia asteroides]UGT53515.1 carbon-nitrogen hydrolase family protein [Nocardia asteroides]